MAWDELTIAGAPKGEELRARARRGADAECVLCGGPLSEGDWQVTVARSAAPGLRREPAHTHCAGDRGWTIR